MITRSGTGWLIKCAACQHETYTERRPAADKAAHNHAKTCKPTTTKEN